MSLVDVILELCGGPESPIRSKKFVKRLIDGRRVKVRGAPATISTRKVHPGDTITVDATPFERRAEITVLFEDPSLLVIDKPAHVTCTADDLISKCPHSHSLFLVHRLDKETSGVMILARTQSAKLDIEKQFQERKVHKKYIAMVKGIVEDEKGLIQNTIGKIGERGGQPIHGPLRPPEGKTAITSWTLLKTGEQFSSILCEPSTGRTHQLRVHLAGIGHPILGDKLYADTVDGLDRHLLHALSIQFSHPITGTLLEFTSPLPSAFNL